MKRFALMLIAAITPLSSLFAKTYPKRAFADYPLYARATVRDAYFYERKNGTSLFAVPYTYCVEVIAEDGEWYHVRYAANSGIYREKTGYCLKKDFDILSEKPEITYLHKTVTVTYSTDVGATSLPVLNELAVEAAYYGPYQAGGEWYSYVYCQGSFGYIQGANDDYPLNELPSAEQADVEEEQESPAKKSGFWSAGLISAIVILALFAAAIIMLHFTAKKPPEGTKRQ